MIRWASTHASRVASNLAVPSNTVGPMSDDEVSNPAELIW